MHDRSKHTAIFLALAFVSLVLACRTDTPAVRNDQQAGASARTAPDSIVLIIDYAEDRADTFRAALSAVDSLSVLDVLRDVAKREGITLKTKDYPMGVLIDQIGTRTNGDGGYWLYSVNGRMIPKAASAEHPALGDTMRFFFNLR